MSDDKKQGSGIIVPFSSTAEPQDPRGVQASQIPKDMPVVPVSASVLYPYMVYPFHIQGAMAEKAVEAAIADNNFIMVMASKAAIQDPDNIDPADLYDVGTVGIVLRMMRDPGGGIRMMVQGLQRARSDSAEVSDQGFITTHLSVLEEPGAAMTDEITALIRSVHTQFQTLARLGKTIPQDLLGMLSELTEPGRLADLVASALQLEIEDAQSILEHIEPEGRLNHVLRLLTGEIEILEIQDKIKSNVKEEMDDRQKRFYLNQQLKMIQKELGQDDPKTSEMESFLKRIREADMTPEAEKQALNEAKRLESMHSDSAEAGVVRTYLDWMTSLPWNHTTKDRLDLKKARAVLDADHHGLDEIKDRIIETLAVKILKPDAQSPILCFVGPPGVGKTSLGQSIARALNRKFHRLSVGGVRDESEVRGHRRTYVGSMPGRIINGLKVAGTSNPVFMIDEIDKMGSDFRGDPSSAMLEVLDPEQNSTFTDHYLDVPFDLSRIMFITTANVLHTIPAPLRDRMEVIHIEGYSTEEKIEIASSYLVPRRIEANGLAKSQVTFRKAALSRIITGYTREAGVRNLERYIGSVCRKVATEIAIGSKKKKYLISAGKIPDYLGSPRSELSKKRAKAEIGVVNGLAWTEAGGEVLHIEALKMEGKGNLVLTGQLGDVMKESVQAALSLVRSKYKEYGIDEIPGPECDIHVHVPAGAVPKDGPSAGVSMFTAIASLFSGRPVRSDIAMTGEISLRGAVLPIGGLKAKLITAKREGATTVLVPASNRNDVAELKASEVEGLEIIYLETVDDLFPHIFLGEEAPLEAVGSFQLNRSSACAT